MNEMLTEMRAAIPGIVVSLVLNGIVLFVLQQYIKSKWVEAKEGKEAAFRIRRQQSEATRLWRHAVGRYLFWLYHAIKKPPANGELEEARENFEEADEQMKELDWRILSEYEANKNQ